MSSSDDAYGPSLPPGMKQDSDVSEDDHYGPSLPPVKNHPGTDKQQTTCTKVIGPVLPSNFAHSSKYSSDSESDSSSSSSSSDSDSSCRHRKKLKRSHVSDKTKDISSISQTVSLEKDSRVLGPSLQQNDDVQDKSVGSDDDDDDDGDDDDDDDIIGPSVGLQASKSDLSAANELESRALKMKQKLTAAATSDEVEVPKQRESWMTELPEQMGANFGLSNRQFRARDAPEQDSSWTEAPHEKGKKTKDDKKKGKRDHFKSDKDKKAIKEIEAYNKKHRPDSLLEMHKKEMKKKKKKEEKKKKKKKDKEPERRPFDRDIDLKVNRFDNAQKQAYIKKSRELGTRFQSGGTGTSFL